MPLVEPDEAAQERSWPLARSWADSCVIELLDGNVVVDGEGGGSAGALARHHEDWFHAAGSECDMAGGKGESSEDVLALADSRDNGTIADGIGIWRCRAKAPFPARKSAGRDALDAVRVDVVGRETNGVAGGASAERVLLEHDVVADHAPGFTDVR